MTSTAPEELPVGRGRTAQEDDVNGAPPPRILIVKLSSLGDVIHALPAVHALRVGLDAEIHWATQTEYVELVQCFPDVERVISFPRRHAVTRWRSFRAALREDAYDMVVDLQGLLKSAFVACTARCDRRIGPPHEREGARFFYHEVAAASEDTQHAVDRCLAVAGHLGVSVRDVRFPVSFGAVVVEGVGPHIALAPRSRWPAKNWDPGKFVDLSLALKDEFGASIHLVGGPEDRGVCDDIARQVPNIKNWCGETSIVELGGLLAAMDVAVTVDTGPMHMAVAAGTPVVAVFGPTDPGRTGPYGEPHRIVQPEDWALEASRSWRSADKELINRVAVDRVYAEVAHLLAGK